MIFGILILLTALTLSAVAAFYSITGLALIFSSAFWPVVIMGAILEIAKLISTVWLHRHWQESSKLLKSYLIMSVVAVSLLTSMGIFGFLSRAHIEQTASLTNSSLEITQITSIIDIEQKKITDANLIIAQLDRSVDSLSSAGKLTGPQGSIALRQKQKDERQLLSNQISLSNKIILENTAKKTELTQQQNTREIEVGPLKYIAELFYGSNIDKNILEKSVRYVIIIIIFVFDPLAIALLLAAIFTFEQSKKKVEVETKIEIVEKIVEVPVDRIVEKIVEVPVDRIVEKIVEVPAFNDTQLDELSKRVEGLMEDLQKKDEIIQKIIDAQQQQKVRSHPA